MTPSITGWQRFARPVGLAVLAAVSVYGLSTLVHGDWRAVAHFWGGNLGALLAIFGLALLDVALEGVAWIQTMERFGLRAADRLGARVYFSANAGRLLPAQLGRLIRPEELVRLGRGTAAQCLKAEAVVFVLDSVAVLALLAALGAMLVHPALAPVAGGAVIAVSLLLGSRLAGLLAGTRLELPAGFWWNWRSCGTVLLQVSGWAAHGFAFAVLVSNLPGATSLWDAMFLAPASAVLGIGTSLPGGIGATEGLLGASLSFHGVPEAHLAAAVAAFRLLTFWVWIPLGWLVLLRLRRRNVAAGAAPEPAPIVAGVEPAPLDGIAG